MTIEEKRKALIPELLETCDAAEKWYRAIKPGLLWLPKARVISLMMTILRDELMQRGKND